MNENEERLLVTRIPDLRHLSFTSLCAAVEATQDTPLADVIDELIDESTHHAGVVVAGWGNMTPADPLPPKRA